MKWSVAVIALFVLALVVGCNPPPDEPSEGTPPTPDARVSSEVDTEAPTEGETDGEATEDAEANDGEEVEASSAEAVLSDGPWAQVKAGDYVTTDSGLIYAILKEGSGKEAKAGDYVSMHYTGWLRSNGSKFDSSLDGGQPFDFDLGLGRVIAGWDEGVAGMQVGEKRQLVIPSVLGYGARGSGGSIPPNADLVFDVELISIR